MSNNKSHNEEVPIEDLFSDVFSDHKEPIDEKDVDQFLSQLEETGFFKKKSRRPYFLILSILGLLGGGVGGYYLFQSNSLEKENAVVSSPINNSNSENIDSGQQLNKDKAIIAPSQDLPFASRKDEVKKDIESKRSAGNNSKFTEVGLKETLPATINKKEVVDEPKTSIKDTTFPTIITTKKIVNKDSVRVKYIIEVDTVRHIDTMNINKKKWSRMKGKK